MRESISFTPSSSSATVNHLPILPPPSSPPSSAALPPTSIVPACVWHPVRFRAASSFHAQPLRDITFESSACVPGLVKITIVRPHVRNAFRPRTLLELEAAFLEVRDVPSMRVVILTGYGDAAFCSGGDQTARGHGGYVGQDGIPRLSVLDLHILMRRLPKVVIAMVSGFAIGGGHILHMVCDLTICASGATFGQTGPVVGSFDGGYGSAYMARIVGQKRAREIWFLCGQYTAQEAKEMGLVNKIVDLTDLERVTVQWAKRIMMLSPTAIACVKAALNADGDGIAGLSQLAGETTRIFYQSEEGKEGRDAYVQKRVPRFERFVTETKGDGGEKGGEEGGGDEERRRIQMSKL